MQTINHPLQDELRSNLLSLAEICPVNECNPDDCPLYLFRKLERPQRRAWLEALSESDLAYLAVYHHVCLKTKLALPPAAAIG